MPPFIRQPAVAGQFYPAEAQALAKAIHAYTDSSRAKSHSLGCIVPHAGYMYSGRIAGSVYSRIELPRCFIILCPNHTGFGEPLSIISSGFFRTPLGDAPIDSDLARELLDILPLLSEDRMAQAREHSLEVHLPFLQLLRPDFVFVPITVGIQQFDYLQQLGTALASVVQRQSEPVLIISSSDMNHYENDALTRLKDQQAIEKMLALDPRGLHEVVIGQRISMCGMGPTVSMLTAVNALGSSKAELVQYATSADVSGDRDRVVGYAGIVVE